MNKIKLKNLKQEYEAHKTPVPSYQELIELQEYKRIVTSYNMKPIDYEVACDTVNKLLDDKQKIKAENERLKELLKECVPYVTFKVNIEKNIGCTPPGAYLLTCIKDALGESEER